MTKYLADNFTIHGKVALVTGGGTGLGREITAALLGAGVERVYIASRNAEVLQATAQELDSSGRCIALPADLSTTDGCRRLADELKAREQMLHVLVNNSGAGWSAPFDDFPERGWDKLFQLNLKTPFFLIQALVTELAAAGTDTDPARVINIGSVAGEIDNGKDTYPYGLSKGALHHATRMLAHTLGERKIAANTIAPGRFTTKMTEFVAADAERFQRERAMIPLGRWGGEGDIGGLAVFLASRASAYMTGATLVVDGGLGLTHPMNLGEE